jgi:CBS domain containing-hemolysin-like protein
MLLSYILLYVEEIGWEEMKHFHLVQPRPLLHSCEHSNEILSCINVGNSLTKLGIVSFLRRIFSTLSSAVLHSISHTITITTVIRFFRLLLYFGLLIAMVTLHITYFNIPKRFIYPTKHNFGFSAFTNLLCKLPQDQQKGY